MALAHLHASVIGAGSCPIASAAYRHRTTMTDTMNDVVSYAHLNDLAHEEIALPVNAPAWLRDLLADKSVAGASEALARAVVERETRVDAVFFGDKEIALPVELDHVQHLALVREFVAEQFTARGLIADWVIHVPTGKADNPHIHLMHTIRELTPDGFGRKCIPVLDREGQVQRVNGKIVYQRFLERPVELKALRLAWGDVVNKHLALAGLDNRIDMRSHAEQGLSVAPTTHIGPKPFAMAERFGDISSLHDHALSRMQAVDDLVADPGQLLIKISRERSTFSAHDIARELARIVDEKRVFHEVLARVMAHPDLVRWNAEVRHPETNRVMQAALYSTREIVAAETFLAQAADRMATPAGFDVGARLVDRGIAAVETADRARPFRFADEQVEAVRHVTGGAAIAAVVGIAGAGKSTMLGAANRAWIADGRRVFGAALAGKAATGLEASSGIASRNLHSWEASWKHGHDLLAAGDVFVIDEAGMVGSLQLSRIVAAVEAAGAKLVLVGDARQLQPIEAGAAFRAITERTGSVELADVRRQREDWAKDATRAFGRGDAAIALTAYLDRGHVARPDDRATARQAIVADWILARAGLMKDGRPLRGDALLVLAHTNADVFALNSSIRAVLATEPGVLTNAIEIETGRGPREFAVGDRIIFLKNERFTESAAPELGRQRVTNGMVGTVTSTTDGVLRVATDDGGTVAFRPSTYRNVDWGYAATVHKNQGTTVDRAFVLATPTMDRSLTYVALTRQRDQVTLYAAKSDFPTFEKLVETLGRVREKTTTLDVRTPAGARAAVAEFAARRSADTAADIAPAFAKRVEALKTWIASGTRQLGEAWGRVATALSIVKERIAVVQRSENSNRTVTVPVAVSEKPKSLVDGIKLQPANLALPAAPIDLSPVRLPAVAPSEPVRPKSRFDGFRPKPGPTLSSGPASPPPSPLLKALAHYLDHRTSHEALLKANTTPAVFEVVALEKAAAALVAVQPKAIAILNSAVRHDPTLRAALAGLTGLKQAEAVLAGINREAKAVANPDVRAARLVTRCNRLDATFAKEGRDRWGDVRPDMAKSLRDFAAALARDPAAQAALHATPEKFDLKPGSALAHAVAYRDVGKAYTELIATVITPPSQSLGFSR